MILALDPGINGCGVAMLESQSLELIHAGYVPNPISKGVMTARVKAMIEAVREHIYFGDAVVTEKPHIYPQQLKGQEPNDLIPLAQIGAGVGCRFNWFEYEPFAWKGNVDADVMTKRILSKLSAEERAHIETHKRGGLDHNTIDAVGLGLFHLGRLNPERVVARC